MRDTVARVLFDESGNAIKVTQDGSDYKYEFLGKLRNAAGTIFNPATEETLAAADTKLGTIDGVLDSIKDTDGIKKITDALPAGSNDIGRVRLRDDHGKDAQFSAFGLLKVANESMLADYRFYEADGITDDFTVVTTGTGSYGFEPGGTGIKLSTGASASSKVSLESIQRHYYQSGRGQLVKFSVILGDTGVAGNIREWGYADADNGVFFRLSGTTLSFVARLNGVETVVPASTWDIPITPDQYGHLFYIQFEWLGVGNYFIYYDEQIVHVHNFLGTSTSLSIGNPDLPIWLKNENTTNDTDVYIKSGCASVVTEGGTIISGLDAEGRLRQCRVDSRGNLFAVLSASIESLPKMVNPYFDKSIGALVANNFRRIMTFVIPDGYYGYLIRYTSWQNESAYSRIVAATEMGDLEFVTDVFTSGDGYDFPAWAGTIEAAVTTQLGATNNVTVTVTYTNELGVGSRVSTTDITKNAPVGTRNVLGLQGDDIGVQSIQNVSVSPSGGAGAIQMYGFVQLAFHDDLSATLPTETNYSPGSVAFPTGTVLGFEFRGGIVSKSRILEALIQLVEET